MPKASKWSAHISRIRFLSVKRLSLTKKAPIWDEYHLPFKSFQNNFSLEFAALCSFHEVNKFVEDNYQYFYPPEDPDDYRFDVGNEHELVADVFIHSFINLFYVD